MSDIARVSKRVDGKIVKGYVVDGQFFRTKKEAGLARKVESKPRRERSDKRSVSSNNRAVVVMSLLARDEIKLVDALLAKNDLEGLQLVGECKTLCMRVMRLIKSEGFSRTLGVKTLRKFSGVSKEFMQRFYSDVKIPVGAARLNLRAYTRISTRLDEDEFDTLADAKAYEDYKRGVV